MWFLGPLMTRKQWIVVTCPTILMLPWLWRFLGGLCYPDFSLSFQATHSDPNLRQEQWKSGCLEVVMLPTSRSPRQSNGKTQPTQLRRPPRKSLRALLKKKCTSPNCRENFSSLEVMIHQPCCQVSALCHLLALLAHGLAPPVTWHGGMLSTSWVAPHGLP